ncbi:GAF domain-containing protein [Candidatus Avelusimicrobium gallicola]|uniref:GAF domain-containing protein n=1 Tax=Candidatus Avelusimicrobium gallicola TaxID=2562704 RepID=A0A1Y4DCI1_9BACT|nr:GAF domain-containing protein [Elusimicrobium sp. An273]OUO56302.1 hypothetical protein B5F75_06715 [Elusimicrobium sp. An273]
MTAVSKTQLYHDLLRQAQALLEIERDPVANMANLAAVLYNGLPQINWAGFYVLKENVLVLGPFQGKPACVRIALGKGVCGTAAQTQGIQCVADVHAFAGHIACDSASRSEVVLPVFKNKSLWGVLDIDAPVQARFDEEDCKNLAEIVRLFEQNSAL